MNDTKKGMLFIMMAAFFFASMNVFVKLSGDLSSIQKSFFRNLIAALFAFIVGTSLTSWLARMVSASPSAIN